MINKTNELQQIGSRLSVCRQNKNMTQEELANKLGVTPQALSKWERGVSMPDITVLPILAEYFQVSTDQLLGLKPLNGENYVPEQTATEDYWNHKLDYLLRTRKNYWNKDYIHFLISQVWNIDQPVSILDCGCGYGFLGLLMLPNLPEESRYTGIDFAEDLIQKGESLFRKQGMKASFICNDVFAYSAENQYDLVICQSVLRHLDYPTAFIQKMIHFTKPGGYVVCMDTNREFESCGLYIDGMDYQTLCRHEGLEKKWQTELSMQGRDYAVAIRTAHIMQKLGLINVDVRMNDKVEFVTPQTANYDERKEDFLTDNHWDTDMQKEEKEACILHLMTHGLSRKEAEDYCDKNTKIAEFFSDHPTAGYTFMRGQMISYGRKAPFNMG